MASSTARNCFKSSSRRVVFFELADDEFDLLELFAASIDLPSMGGGERFFDASAAIEIRRDWCELEVCGNTGKMCVTGIEITFFVTRFSFADDFIT